MTRPLYGRPLAEQVNAASAGRASLLRERGIVPALAVVSAVSDPAAARYLGRLQRAGRAVGVEVHDVSLPRDAGPGTIGNALDTLGGDERTSGVLLLTPLPPGVDLAAMTDRIPHRKDVEGMHPLNAGFLAGGRPRCVPTTAEAVIALLHHYDIPLRGTRVTVVGRSAVFGRPLASLLLLEHATVTIAHSRTPDLAEHTRTADIIAIGIGRPGALKGDMVGTGAVVIDAGMNVTPEGVVGDVDAVSLRGVAAAYSPVPGGLGAVTTALLLRNVVAAAESPDATQTGLPPRNDP